MCIDQAEGESDEFYFAVAQGENCLPGVRAAQPLPCAKQACIIPKTLLSMLPLSAAALEPSSLELASFSFL